MGYFLDKTQQAHGWGVFRWFRLVGPICDLLKLWIWMFFKIFFFGALGEWGFQHLLWNDSIRFIMWNDPSKFDMQIPNLMIPLAFSQGFPDAALFFFLITILNLAEFQHFSHEVVCAFERQTRRFEANCSKCSTPSTTPGNSRWARWLVIWIYFRIPVAKEGLYILYCLPTKNIILVVTIASWVGG